MSRVVAIGKSIYDTIMFGTLTVGSVMVFLTLIGFLMLVGVITWL